MRSDVFQSCGTEECITKRMDQRVAIGMRHASLFGFYIHAAQAELQARFQSMGVVTESYSEIHLKDYFAFSLPCVLMLSLLKDSMSNDKVKRNVFSSGWCWSTVNR